MIDLVIIVVLAGLLGATRSFTDSAGSSGTAVSFGFLLLAGFFMGRLFARMRLPKLTGYLATGLVAGPAVLALVPEKGLGNLAIFNGIAISLIALTAGLELELPKLKPLFRHVSLIGIFAILMAAFAIGVTLYVFRGMLPFMAELSSAGAISVCVMLAVVMAAQSPAVVVALRDETDADGPVVRTVLGIVVLGDLVVILLFAAVSSVTKAVLGGEADPAATLRTLAWELLGSILAGLVVGASLALILRTVRAGAGLFVVTTCFVVAEVGRRVHLDPLLVCLTAGVLVRNATSHGHRLHEGIEQSALPVYVVFFCVTGASIHLDVLATLGFLAGAVVVARAAGLLTGAFVGARLSKAPDVVRRYAGFGLLPQAGLALALALLLSKTFPELGEDAGALTLGVVAINEILMPALYRFAILRAGEARAPAAGTPLPDAAGEPADDDGSATVAPSASYPTDAA